MQVLKILSLIWKSGAEIYRDESDGRLALKNAKLVPPDVLKAAEPIFPQIEEWFKSWEGASSEKVTLMKMINHICGWQDNEKLNNWLCNDLESLDLFNDWMIVLANNGWINTYDDYRQFENDESNKLAHELYKRAVVYAKKVNV